MNISPAAPSTHVSNIGTVHLTDTSGAETTAQYASVGPVADVGRYESLLTALDAAKFASWGEQPAVAIHQARDGLYELEMVTKVQAGPTWPGAHLETSAVNTTAIDNVRFEHPPLGFVGIVDGNLFFQPKRGN